MATTSTVPTAKARIVAKAKTALQGEGTPVTYAWPGKSTVPECVFLGPHPETADIRLDLESDIPTIKAGRQQRQENYTVRVTIWTFRPELTSADAETCETRAFELLGHLEDEFADDPRLALPAPDMQLMSIESVASTLFPFKAGWACELAVDIAVKARLR